MRVVTMLALALALAGCGSADRGAPDGAAAEGGLLDAQVGLRQNGETCGQSAGGAACATGLLCCYPCGIPGCDFRCEPRPAGGMCLPRP